ncbi:MAG: heavy metal-associated domain-containing protein, partial [Thiomicrorhabdus sp.]|nr:heavy metal-associated domain-containing protein [Thiomicrorhabdus sp.]
MEAISVENIKCGGCANGIEQALLAINGVEKVIVDIEAGLVSCELSTENNQDAILDVVKQKLLSMGYPEV